MQWLEDNTDSQLECVRYAGATLVSDACQETSVDNEAEDTELLENFLNENYDNPIEKAEYCVAYGCIEKGQELLEAEILTHKKQNPLIEQALLSIYYYSQNKDALDKMTQNLLEINQASSEDWKKIQSLAKEW
jgi:excinuclease UvrABC nuclease subunit